MGRYRQGKFKCRNPAKYRGDPLNICYRSSWELRLMMHFDSHPGVIWWQSEEIAIAYRSPLDNRPHRYFPDFIISIVNKDGKPETIMIEVKPRSQAQAPKKQQKVTKRYLTEVARWGVNQAKWSYAENYCKDRGWKFQVMTEQDIFGLK